MPPIYFLRVLIFYVYRHGVVVGVFGEAVNEATEIGSSRRNYAEIYFFARKVLYVQFFVVR